MAAAYIRRGRKVFEMRVPLTRGRGDGPIRSLETDDPDIKSDIESLVKRLLKKPEYFSLIDAITASPPQLSLMDLYLADRSNRLDELVRRLRDVDLTLYLDGWEKWVRSNLGDTGTAEMYRAQVETLVLSEEDSAFMQSELTTKRVNEWLADYKASTGYKRKLLYALFSFIRYLIEVGVFDHNPIENITRPKKGKKRVRWETEENDIRIVEAAPIEYQGLFALIKATGAEVTPATLLTTREIQIWPKDEKRYCGVAHIPGTKTETRDRHDVLIEKWARPYILKALHGKLPNARVWPGISRYMAHWHHQNAAGAVEVLDYTLRDARHSWAVRGRKARPQVTFEAIAAQLGNTVAVVADVYADFKMTPEERLNDGVSDSAVSTETATRSDAESKVIPIRESVSQ